MTKAPTPYELAQRRGQEVLRRTVLDTASRLLLEHGPEVLTMRRLAGAIGCSTTVLYTMFGGKQGIADALYREGFERLRRRLAAVPAGGNPLERLSRLAQAYRENAIEERPYYGVMFERAIPGFQASPEALATAGASLSVLVDAVRDCMEAGAFRREDPQAAGEVLWAAAHGVVSLELAGHLGPAQAAQRFGALTAAAGTAYLAGGPEAGR